MEDFVAADVQMSDAAVLVQGHDLINQLFDDNRGLRIARAYRLGHFGHVAEMSELLEFEDELHVTESLYQGYNVQAQFLTRVEQFGHIPFRVVIGGRDAGEVAREWKHVLVFEEDPRRAEFFGKLQDFDQVIDLKEEEFYFE